MAQSRLFVQPALLPVPAELALEATLTLVVVDGAESVGSVVVDARTRAPLAMAATLRKTCDDYRERCHEHLDAVLDCLEELRADPFEDEPQMPHHE